MTKEETARILAVLKAAYPHSFQNLTKADAEALMVLWCRQFASDSLDSVSAAVDALIATRKEGFSPTIGEVKAQMQRLDAKDELDDTSAWAMVSKACSNGLYGYREEFSKLPEEVQRVVGAPEQLKAWAKMDAETVESVVASNFMRNFRVMQKRKRETAMLPQEVRDRLFGTSGSMLLGDRT